MSLESSLKEVCEGLRSNRANERKKNGELLKDFLTRNAVPCLLRENTLNKRGYTWSDVFDDINDYVMKELEKYETSKTFDSVTGPLLASLLNLCVSGANKGGSYIKCDKVLDACLIILKDSRLAKGIGDAYITLLYRHVLPFQYYLGFITPKTWEELLEVSITACSTNISKLDDFTKLRIVLLVMRNGKNSCQFVLPLRDILHPLKKCFLKLENDKKVQEVIMDIIILLLETLSTESRLTMCKFSEDVLPMVLKFYTHSLDRKKKILLFKLLNGVVILHHPKGRLQKEEASLAYDWEIWNKHLKNVLEIVCLETVNLQKNRKQNDIPIKANDDFYILCANVFYQVFSMPEVESNDEENLSKRPRLSFNKNKRFKDIIEELKQSHVPWLGIVNKYLENYGNTVTNEYLLLITYIQNSISKNSAGYLWEIFESFTIHVLNNSKKHFINMGKSDEDVLTVLWNSCVRNSTLSNMAHTTVHKIIQELLSMKFLDFQQVQPLMKLYYDRGMPVTNSSINTLNIVFHKYYSKCSSDNLRIELFTWLVYGEIGSIEVKCLKEFISKLIANENINYVEDNRPASTCDYLHSVLFNSIEDSILYGEYEFDTRTPANVDDVEEVVKSNIVMETHVQNYLKEYLSKYVAKLASNDVDFVKYVKFVNINIFYFSTLLKYNKKIRSNIKDMQIYSLLKHALGAMCEKLHSILKTDAQIVVKTRSVEIVTQLMKENFDTILDKAIRSCFYEDLFKCINRILTAEQYNEDNDIIEENEDDININTLKHNCVYLLAAFCRKMVDYRDDILDFILDPKCYNFKSDVQCALKCVGILLDDSEQPPYDLIVHLMQNMCKNLYRDSISSYGILSVLKRILDKISFLDDTKRQNCYIIVKSYLLRAKQGYYPPKVAGLVYECAIKIVTLNRQGVCTFQDTDIFEETVVQEIKGKIQSIRLYASHLLKAVFQDYTEDDVETFHKNLFDIFLVDVSRKREVILKDEAANRTLTVLHAFRALAETNTTLMQKHIIAMLTLQKEKSLDKTLLKKVFNIIIKTQEKDIETYLNRNVLSILYYWYTNNMGVENLPVYFFGCKDFNSFVKIHLNWLLPADILWSKKGNIQDSNILKQVMTSSGQSLESIIQKYYNYFIVICIPYKVSEKYFLEYTGSENLNLYKKSIEYSNKMFQQTCQILKRDTWNNLFEKNIPELIFLAALNLCDSEETSKQFNIKIQGTPKYYYYTTSVFLCILKFFGESKEEDIMEYLCENHSLTIFKALFHLWQNVRMEKSFKLKVLSLNTYVTFVDNIPLGYSSDAFVCNFICKSYVEALQLSRYKEEIRIYAQGLKGFLEKMFPSKLELARKSISQLLPILVLKKEEGFEAECAHLLNYLLEDLREYLSESVDVVDYVRSISQGRVDNAGSVSLTSFMDKFKVYKKNLSCPSYEILLNLREFISVNKGFINILYNKLDCKGFSEDCGKSPIHEMIYLLNNILKSTADAKTITEACNCLSEIGTYDLKSLVTVPPPNVQKIVHINPNNYFVGTVIKCLTEVIFTEDPTVTEKIAQALNIFLKYFENIDLLDIEDLDRQILKPLMSEDKHIRTEFTINTKLFDDICTKYENGIFVKLLEENYKDGVINECNWLKQVTNELLSLFDSTSNCLEMLEQVCSSKTIICEKILPSLIGLLVYCLSEIQVRSFSDQINNFFNYIWKETHENNDTFYNHFKNRNSIATVEHSRKMIIQNMLHVVDFLRLQKKYYKQRAGRRAECYNYLNLDYSKVAWAASVANQHLVALFYGELWALSRNDGVPPSSPEATANLPNGAHVLQLFRKCYVAIGEMDALDGCGTAHLTIEKEKREHLINTCQYSDALLLHDIALSCEDNEDPRLKFGVVRSLHKFGMHHLALQYIKSLPESNELNEIKYDCLSYLGDWSELVDVREIKEKSKNTNCHNYIFKALHYACLKDSFMIIEPSDYNNKIEELVNDTKLSVSKLCINLNMENCQNVYKIVGKLHLLTDIEKYTSVKMGSIPIEEILHEWSIDNLPRYKDFKHLEALISQRVLLLEDMAKSCEDSVKKIISLQLQYAKLALINDRIPMAQRLLAIVKKWHSSDEVVLVDSEISWVKGHKDIALSLVRNILRNEHTNVDLTATSLRKYALWIAESKRDNPRDIINKYLLTSLKVLKESENAATRLKVYHDIAKFADAEYKQVVTYMKSSVFEHKVKCMENMKGTASTLKSTQQSLTKDEKKALLVNDRFGNLDEAEIANTKIEKETFLLLAMKYYLLSLKQCDKNNLSIFRIISLWLENRCFQFEDGEPQNAFKSLLNAIPSRKFIAVLPQLVPHLTNEKSDFAIYLKDIIKRCALEHPHHTLPLVFSLKNSEKDKLILNESGVTSKSKQKTPVREPLVAAAEDLVTELQNSQLAKIIQQMEALCDAIISFANYKPQNKSTPKQSIPSAEKICRLKNLDSIPVPTATIAISSNCDYSKIYSIKSFDSHFELVGGINCPKKIFCTDSSGHKRILLVKGEDDLKQDAVMQQVFNIVNMLLEQNPVTSRNNLIIRTYKVVPMSRQSGVLEWCVGTIPLGTYLSGTGNNGAHNIYRPQDISCKAARIQLMECHQAKEKTSNKEKLRVFLKILSELKPVFHYFFTEHFLDPVTWYERRLAYTKSVATSSMVGYILGLGDRHVMNILIDKRTAEVIHIDFGIAFDQGKTLHTPETVPFRLTQDMVAGFGASGVEGLFTRCCEKTMRLLRDNQETLLTILEVLLCDPLYSWRVANTQQSTPANRNTSVNCAGASKSSLAERALLCVSSKLVGAEAEAGAAGGVAVPGQVARLIRAATDHANLSRLYPGWQPYL